MILPDSLFFSSSSRSAIKKAFSQLLEEKNLQDITIKQLTDLADIHRATFYSHYEDIFDLYHEFENDIFENLTSIFENQSLTSYQSFYNALFDYIQDNPMIAKAFFLNTTGSLHSPLLQNLMDYFVAACKNAWLEEGGITKISAEMEYFAHYRVYGIIAVIRHWIDSACSMPLDELKKLIASLDADVDSFMMDYDKAPLSKP